MKFIGTLIILIFFSNSALSNETFSMFGFEINSVLDTDKYKFDGWQIEMEKEECNVINRDSSFDSICFMKNYVTDSNLTYDTPPPLPNKYFKNYWLSIEDETKKIKKISAWTKDNLLTDRNCSVMKNAIVTTIRKNNQSKKVEFYEFYQNAEVDTLEYSRKTNKEDKFIYEIQCKLNNKNEIRLGVSLSNPYTFVEKFERFLDDTNLVDTTGFYDLEMLSCIMDEYFGMFSRKYIFYFNYSFNKLISMSNENYSEFHDMFYVANKDENKIHLVERGNNTNFIIDLNNMTAHWDTITKPEGISYTCSYGDARIVFVPSDEIPK